MTETDEVVIPIRADNRDFKRKTEESKREIDNVEKKGKKAGAFKVPFLGGVVGGAVGAVAGAAMNNTATGMIMELAINTLIALLLPFIMESLPFLKKVAEFLIDDLGPAVTSLVSVLNAVHAFLTKGSQVMPTNENLGEFGAFGHESTPLQRFANWHDTKRRELNQGLLDYGNTVFDYWFGRHFRGEDSLPDPDFEGSMSGTRSSQSTATSGD